MAAEKITFNVLTQRFDPDDPTFLFVDLDIVLSASVNGFTGGRHECRVLSALTESQIGAFLADCAAEYVMTQTAPNVYTAADVRRVA